jgi:AcrR family transcriptional regulator
MANKPLSRQRIVCTAIELLERDGAAALTMRRLGAELDVEAMSLYHHVANRDDLLAAIGAELLRPLDVLALDDGWQDACRAFATTLRRIATTSPTTFGLYGLQPFEGADALRAVERMLAALMAGGFDAPGALAVYRAVASYARGYALAEVTGFTVDAAAAPTRERLAALPADDFPILAGRIDELATLDSDRAFALGLEALIAGLDR